MTAKQAGNTSLKELQVFLQNPMSYSSPVYVDVDSSVRFVVHPVKQEVRDTPNISPTCTDLWDLGTELSSVTE